MMFCSAMGCGDLAKKRGLCKRHYDRLWYAGLPPRPTPEERFWSKVETTGPPQWCWIWTTHLTPAGYGRFFPEREKAMFAHRFSYEMFLGPIPEGLTLDHLCRNRKCVNPAHLEAVTNHENILRGVGPTAINARKTHCPRGHPYDGVISTTGERICRRCRRTDP